MAFRISILLTCLSLLVILASYRSASQVPDALAPEGCRMSYMWPSYVLQTDFNYSWTPLSRRYTLWLYREAGWEKSDELHGAPVLFIPGNAGSSKQARSIASSACRQYFASPDVRSPDFHDADKALDVFTADFNEDLSALHGPTLLAQSKYTSDAIRYILSKYPPGTRITVMGHSMGGVVAMSLLPSPHISAIITMSTPHTLPPARFDRRIERIFAASSNAGMNDSTPVLSICGGATDIMVPSESCVLPYASSPEAGFRKTVFTSSINGVWSGVGHQSMVWCHQVRWRVARAALEIGSTHTPYEVARVLDKWFRSESVAVPSGPSELDLRTTAHTRLGDGEILSLQPLAQEINAYIFPPLSPGDRDVDFTLIASGVTVTGLGPQKPSWTTVSILLCADMSDALVLNCEHLSPTVLRLLAHPRWGRAFPIPNQGADESEGIVIFRARVSSTTPLNTQRIVVKTEFGWSEAWVLATSAPTVETLYALSHPFLGVSSIDLDPRSLSQDITLKFGIPTSLLTYHLYAHFDGDCGEVKKMPPLAVHRSSKSEEYIHALYPGRTSYLHSHTNGPFISRLNVGHETLLTILNSGECGISRINISVNWWHSLGIWAIRYWGAVAAWGVSMVTVTIFRSWHVVRITGLYPSYLESLDWVGRRVLLYLAIILTAVATIPLPQEFLLGNSGDPRLALLPALVVIVSYAYVCLLGVGANMIIAILGFMKGHKRRPPSSPVTFGRVMSMAFILLLVAFVVPHQVAYVIFLADFLWSCATLPGTFTPAKSQREHTLALLFVLLPLQAPVLPVWVRTLLTAGYTTPFDGDHNVLNILPMMILVGFSPPYASSPLWDGRSPSALQIRVTSVLLATLVAYPFLFGARWMFGMYDIANLVAAWLALVKYGHSLAKILLRQLHTYIS